MVRPFVFLAILSTLFLDRAHAQTNSVQSDLVLIGYITRSASLADFDVNGFRVISNSQTEPRTGSLQLTTSGGDVFFGERVALYGKIDYKKHQVEATKIIFIQPEPRTLSGVAVIDCILKPMNNGELLLRADGYLMKIGPTTKLTFASPLASLSDVNANSWITYHGILNPDGLLLTDTVSFRTNNVSDRESKLLGRTSYDPSAVPSDSKQSVTSKMLIGWDPKKVPPYNDQAMQERVSRIGMSLIPAYQRQLPPGDPSKIPFQFQVIDRAKVHDAFVLPSGVILVPHQVVERLQNDSQLATVLADNIAIALEKQAYRMQPANTSMSVADAATAIGGIFVPGLSLASLAMYPAGKSMQTDLLNQSGRVSLGLLRDAGYDIQQAPVAWWLLASKPSKSLTETSVPPRALNLYQTIGLVWKNYPSGTPAVPPAAPSAPTTALSSN
jgi:hypothetical protein